MLKSIRTLSGIRTRKLSFRTSLSSNKRLSDVCAAA